jgi:hypothetical protein
MGNKQPMGIQPCKAESRDVEPLSTTIAMMSRPTAWPTSPSTLLLDTSTAATNSPARHTPSHPRRSPQLRPSPIAGRRQEPWSRAQHVIGASLPSLARPCGSVANGRDSLGAEVEIGSLAEALAVWGCEARLGAAIGRRTVIEALGRHVGRSGWAFNGR